MTSRGRVLLVGAGGFVGPWLARGLCEAGWSVTGLSRRSIGAALPESVYRSVHADITDIASCRGWMDEADAIVFNAAYIPKNYAAVDEAETCLRVNALAPLAVLQALAERPRPFLYISGAQGYAERDVPARESEALFPAHHATYYLGSKLLGDLYTEHHRLMHGIPAAVLRLGALYGPGLRTGMVASLIAQARRGGPVALQNGGKFASDLTYVGDAAQALTAALARGATGIFNIGTGRRTSALDAARLVIGSLGSDPNILSIEPPVSTAPTGFAALDIAHARAELGFTPTYVSEGIRQTVLAWRD